MSSPRNVAVRRGNAKALPVDEAKKRVLEALRNGAKVADACALVQRSTETYRGWQKDDAQFADAVRALRLERQTSENNGTQPVPDFATFCRDYLHEPLFAHQLRALDILEGREPRGLHPSMNYEPGDPGRVLYNFPPNHCPATSTMIPTTRGLIRADEVIVGDFLFDQFGKPTEVMESETVSADALTTDQFRVTFNTGDSFVVDASHLWFARDLAQGSKCLDGPMLTQYRTDQLAHLGVLTKGGKRRWRIDNALPAQHDAKDLPLDPYILGYWLGDGDTNQSRFAVGDKDLNHLTTQLDKAGFTYTVREMFGGNEVYAHKMRHLLNLGTKSIPESYLSGSHDQRLALLQGLMDTDGTITVKDSRARFVQADVRLELAEQVYQLAASLGYQPRLKRYTYDTKLPRDGTATANTVEVSFRTRGEPVFRLERKASRQKSLTGGEHSARRTIVSIERLDTRESVQQITVDGDSSILIGAGHIVTHNAKTTSFSINYAVWLLHKDPNVKIAIVSKSQGFAKKILAGIKTRLTSNAYREMHQRFAPGGGWRDPDQSWTQTMIYVQGKDDGAKDPTVEAVGLGGQIYGGRFDVIICDDVIDNENAHRHADHVDWLMTILDSRLPPEGGLLMVLGTRIAATDLYSELRKLTDENDEQFFSYLSQPAVLEYGPTGQKDEWVTLWPWTNCTELDAHAELRCIACMASSSDCACESPEVMWCKPRWTGAKLARKRFPLGERRWSLVWQQQQIPDDATFNQRAVEASINRSRRNGPLTAGGMGHPADGMNGMYVIGGLDPATVGNTAMIVVALDRARKKRYVLDGYNAAGISPATMRERVKLLTRQYGVNEWVIERNAFQRFLTQDPELNAFLRERGCKLTEHYTTGNKLDPDFGVMSLAPLFDSCGEAPSNSGGGGWKRTPEKALIELPDDRTSGWCTELVKQLIMWEPSGLSQGTKTDLVMALWFTEIAAKRVLGFGQRLRSHLENRFATKGRLKHRGVVSLAELREAAIFESEAGE